MLTFCLRLRQICRPDGNLDGTAKANCVLGWWRGKKSEALIIDVLLTPFERGLASIEVVDWGLLSRARRINLQTNREGRKSARQCLSAWQKDTCQRCFVEHAKRNDFRILPINWKGMQRCFVYHYGRLKKKLTNGPFENDKNGSLPLRKVLTQINVI